MTEYRGSLFGINYLKDFDTDDEFVEWFINKLKAQKTLELWQKIITAVLNESTEFKALKEKVSP
jgi:hypothetical protein